MEINKLTVEFLRAGPRHNQLLSPLTPYLAVCGDWPAGIVNVPFEQAVFERQREDLRYGVSADQNTTERRLGVLDQTGVQMAQMLAAVPGVAGAINSQANSSEILHLRIVISASELAALPFELSKLPIGGGSGEWLQIRANQPVCLTRHNRSVSSEKVKWPTRPRILYIAGPDVPAEEHERVLKTVLEPWTDKGAGIDEWLTILREPSIAEIEAVTSNAEYTHVHILAHGAPFKDSQGSFGVNLKADVVVSGRELAQALTSVNDKIHIPTVITMATCQSAEEPAPVHPAASVAHELHEAGIPLVVASQFPLSVKGSLPFVETFYQDQLWGTHPLISLYKIRLALYANGGRQFHDWASIIAYEALPSNIDDQLHELEYRQKKRVLEGSLTRLERACERLELRDQDQYEALNKELEIAHAKLPQVGPYEAECHGLRAASWKRRAQVEFLRANAPNCYRYLESALTDYQKGTDAFLVGGEKPVQRVATLHWLLCQVLSLECVLGKPFSLRPWMAAVFSVEAELSDSSRGSMWGHGTLSELYLIRLADPKMTPAARQHFAEKAMKHAKLVVHFNPLLSDQVQSARRQFERYLRWWSHAAFVKMLEPFRVPDKNHWRVENGLVDTAGRIIEILGGGMPFTRTTAPPPKPPDLPEAPIAAPPLLPSTRPIAVRTPAGAIFDIEMMPAENGDCLWIEYGDAASPHRVVIDCGAKSAAKLLYDKTDKIKGKRSFDLFVLTHIDSDHISGVPAFFAKLPPATSFEEIWFNGWRQLPKDKLGVRQAEEFSTILETPEFRPHWNRSFGSSQGIPHAVEVDGSGPRSFTLAGGMTVTILSPGHAQLENLAGKWLEGLKELHPEETNFLGRSGSPPAPIEDFEKFDVEALAATQTPPDPSVANGSSIALLLEYAGAAALVTGDAYPQVVTASIQQLMKQRGKPAAKLRLDALKLAHHGSKNGLSTQLLAAIECPKYLISTNGAKFYHPDRESIAKVILNGGAKPTLCFNYVSQFNEIWGNPILTKRFAHRTVYPAPKESGLRVALAKERPPRARSVRV